MPPGSILEAARSCGIQNTPHGSAELSILARVDKLRPGEVDKALEDHNLVQAWSLRASPHVFPAEEYGTYTAGVLPPDDRSTRHFISGANEHLDRAGMAASRLISVIVPLIAEVLDGRGLVKDDLGREVADRMTPSLTDEQRTLWNEPDAYGRFGETLVRYGLYVASLKGAVCHGPREGTSYLMVRPDQWLCLPRVVAGQARADIVRRYLHCYGPTTPGALSQWAGISKEQAASQWSLVSPEMVDLGPGVGWLLSSDLDALDNPPTPEGTRLLPPHDPYLQARDRLLLVPDRSNHGRIWRAAGNPGAVLQCGELIGTWQPRTRNSTFTLEITPFASLASSERNSIREEAELVARLRGAEKLMVNFAPPH
jgi:hypothetical protein